MMLVLVRHILSPSPLIQHNLASLRGFLLIMGGLAGVAIPFSIALFPILVILTLTLRFITLLEVAEVFRCTGALDVHLARMSRTVLLACVLDSCRTLHLQRRVSFINEAWALERIHPVILLLLSLVVVMAEFGLHEVKIDG